MKFQIQGMTCGGCVTRVTKTVQALDPAAKVEADIAAKTVEIHGSVSQEQIVLALTEAGYPTKAL